MEQELLPNPELSIVDQEYVAQQVAEADALSGSEVIALAHAEIKEPIGIQVFHTVDASNNGIITVTATNFGKNVDGTYTNAQKPASVWIGGQFVGEGASQDDALQFAISKGMLPVGSTVEDLASADLGNDMYVAVKVSDGRWIVLSDELKGVENWSGKITVQDFDVMAELAQQGIVLGTDELKNLEVRTQVKGVQGGGTSLGRGVTVTHSVPSTTTTTSTTTTSTTTTSIPQTTTTTSATTSTTSTPPTTIQPSTTTTLVPTTSRETTTTLSPSTTSIVRQEVSVPVTVPYLELAQTGGESMAVTVMGIGAIAAGMALGIAARIRMRKSIASDRRSTGGK